MMTQISRESHATKGVKTVASLLYSPLVEQQATVQVVVLNSGQYPVKPGNNLSVFNTHVDGHLRTFIVPFAHARATELPFTRPIENSLDMVTNALDQGVGGEISVASVMAKHRAKPNGEKRLAAARAKLIANLKVGAPQLAKKHWFVLLRESKAISQVKLANDTGMQQANLSRLEKEMANGIPAGMKMETLNLIAKALSLKVSELLMIAEENTTTPNLSRDEIA